MSVAAIGAIVAIGGTAYSIYSQEQAKNAANSATPKPFIPVDIGKTAKLALDADKAGYAFSDADWKNRFPKLALGKEYNIADAGLSLSGGTSKTITDTLDKSGLSANLGKNEFQKAQNLGLPILAIEQRDRNYFQKQLAMSPQRTAGLSGQDVTRIAVANTGGQNNFNQGIFQSNIAKYNAGIQQGIQNTNAAISGLGSLAGLFTNNTYQRSPYETGQIFSGGGFGHEGGG